MLPNKKMEKNYVLKIAERDGYELKPLIMSSLILKHLIVHEDTLEHDHSKRGTTCWTWNSL